MAFNFTHSTPVSGEVTITGSSGTPTPGSTITIPKEDGSGNNVIGIANSSFNTFNNPVFQSGTFELGMITASY